LPKIQHFQAGRDQVALERQLEEAEGYREHPHGYPGGQVHPDRVGQHSQEGKPQSRLLELGLGQAAEQAQPAARRQDLRIQRDDLEINLSGKAAQVHL
jgi:hypothetical protein